MKFISKRALSAILTIVMVMLMVPYANAATSEYEKNTEDRHITCNSLSEQAVEYYSCEVKDMYNGIGSVVAGDSTVYSRFASLANAETNVPKGTALKDVSSYSAYKGDSPTYYQTDGSGNYVLDDGNKVEVCTNSLFYALHNIMQDTYTTKTSYSGYTKSSLAQHWLSTDTTGSSDNEFYTYFYSDFEANSHADMQREHIWPKSRASYHMATGGGGADLHHLRPAVGKVNLKKLNWAFGNHDNAKYAIPEYNIVKVDSTVDGILNKKVLWKFINQEGDTCIDVNKNIRGDVARILLYVYVMWSQPNLFTDLSYTAADEAENEDHKEDTGIPELLPELDQENNNHDTGLRAIESLETLLDWMKEDPVDTWEMKRNDITESIQGNRNVFIDYPELAWLLFDQTVPTDMTTPSGMANSGSDDVSITAELTDPITVNFGDNILNSTSYNGKSIITAYYKTGVKDGVRKILTTTDTNGYENIKKVYINTGQRVERDTMIYYTVEMVESTFSGIGANGNCTSVVSKVNGNNCITDTGYTELVKDEDNNVIKCSFHKKADGYNLGDNRTSSYTEPVCTDETKEEITICGKSKVCELRITSNLGTHSGLYYASYIKDGEKVEVTTGDLVPDNTDITIVCVPDAVSTFDHVTYETTTQTSTDNKDGTYTTVVNVTSKGKTRESNIKIYWGSDSTLYNSVFTAGNFKGYMGHEAGDTFYQYAQFIRNFEITGIQIKAKHTETRDLRYVSVINSRLISEAEEYGFLVATTTKKDAEYCMNNGYTLTYDKALEAGSPITKIDCKGTENNISGDWGKEVKWVSSPTTEKPDRTVPDTKYKYVTMAIEDIPAADADTVIIVRPYIRFGTLSDNTEYNKTIYGEYIRNTDESFTACAASYNQIIGLAE